MTSKIIINHDKIQDAEPYIKYSKEKVYKRKDFNEESIREANKDLKNKIKTYIDNKTNLDLKYPIIELELKL